MSGGAWRGLSLAFACALLLLAFRVYIGRFERLLEDHTIFAGVTYTDAHVTLTGMLIVAGALVVGALIALVNAVSAPRVRWLVAAVAPAAACYVAVGVLGWYVNGKILRRRVLPRGQLRAFKLLMPLLRREESRPPAVGMSLLAIARKGT